MAEDAGDVCGPVLRRQVQQRVAVHIDIVQTALSFAVEIDEGMLAIGDNAIHQGCHEGIVAQINAFVVQTVNQIDDYLKVASESCNVQRCLASVVWYGYLGSVALHQGPYCFDLSIVGCSVQKSQTLLRVDCQVAINAFNVLGL